MIRVNQTGTIYVLYFVFQVWMICVCQTIKSPRTMKSIIRNWNQCLSYIGVAIGGLMRTHQFKRIYSWTPMDDTSVHVITVGKHTKKPVRCSVTYGACFRSLSFIPSHSQYQYNLIDSQKIKRFYSDRIQISEFKRNSNRSTHHCVC